MKFMMEVLYEQGKKKGRNSLRKVLVSYESPKRKLSGVEGFSNLSESLQE